MAIQQIIIKKFKKLENIQQELNGNHILLMGENGVGKTSVIQFIEIALGNTKKIPPFAEGSGELAINHKGKLVTIKVDFRDGKPFIKVRGDGISIDNNKSAIAQLFGAVEFDIEHFAGLSKTKAGRKEQVEIFKSFLPKDLQADLLKFENNLKNHESDRTELGRDIAKLKGAMALHPLNNYPNPELLKFKPTDTAEVMAKLKAANDANANIKTVEQGISSKKLQVADKEKQIAELEAKILKLREEVKTVDAEIKKGFEWLNTHPVQEIGVFEKQLEDAAKVNQDYASAQSLLKDREKLETFENEYGEATALIESTREAIANAIRDEHSPIAGLSYDDEQLVFNGMAVNPDVMSKSEIMELGLKFKLAENPDLGLLFIPEAESLGAERFLQIKEMAEKNNCQLIAEQVQRGQKDLTFEIMTEELIGA